MERCLVAEDGYVQDFSKQHLSGSNSLGFASMAGCFFGFNCSWFFKFMACCTHFHIHVKLNLKAGILRLLLLYTLSLSFLLSPFVLSCFLSFSLVFFFFSPSFSLAICHPLLPSSCLLITCRYFHDASSVASSTIWFSLGHCIETHYIINTSSSLPLLCVCVCVCVCVSQASKLNSTCGLEQAQNNFMRSVQNHHVRSRDVCLCASHLS